MNEAHHCTSKGLISEGLVILGQRLQSQRIKGLSGTGRALAQTVDLQLVEELWGSPIPLDQVDRKVKSSRNRRILYEIPATAKIVTASASDLFRYYAPAEDIPKILKHSNLVSSGHAGVTPEDYRAHYYYVNEESSLTGIFMTKPDQSSSSGEPYVDFRLPEGTKFLELDRGEFLILGQINRPEWIQNYYLILKKDPSAVPLYLQNKMREIDYQGGLLPPTQQKIEVLNYSTGS